MNYKLLSTLMFALLVTFGTINAQAVTDQSDPKQILSLVFKCFGGNYFVFILFLITIGDDALNKCAAEKSKCKVGDIGCYCKSIDKVSSCTEGSPTITDAECKGKNFEKVKSASKNAFNKVFCNGNGIASAGVKN